MAEALAALGIFCNVLSVAEFAYKILSKGYDIHKAADASGILQDHEALEETSRELGAKNEALQQSLWESLQLPAGARDEDDVALNKLALECNREATELINQLRKCVVRDAHHEIKSVRSALKANWDKDKIDATSRRMKGYQDAINNRLLVSMSLRQKLITAQQTEGFELLVSRNDQMSDALKQLQLSQRQMSSAQGTQHQALVEIMTAQHEEVMQTFGRSGATPTPGGDRSVIDDSPVDDSKTRMLELVKQQQVEPVKELVSQKRALAVQTLDYRERTALHYAAAAGNLELIRALIKRGAVVEAQDEDNSTPLHLAAKANAPTCVRYLVFQGANRDALDDSMKKPVHYATSESAWILKYGHEMNAHNEDSKTALIYFIQQRDAKAVQSLLQQGAPHSYQGATSPLEAAAEQGNIELTTLLLKAGADVNLQSSEGGSALQKATLRGHLKIVKVLLEHGADINMTTKAGFNALHEACNNGQDTIGEFLVQQGADLDLPIPSGQMAIHQAAKFNCIKTITAMLAVNPAYAHVRSKDGWKPLCEASWWGHEFVVNLLLDYGSDVRWRGNNHGYPALMLAAKVGHVGVIRLLAQKGKADLNPTDRLGETALIKAIRERRVRVVRELIDLGADANCKEVERGGWPPLSFAMQAEGGEMLKYLLQEGCADPNVRHCDSGATPLLEAVTIGQTRAVEILLDAGADPNMVDVESYHRSGKRYPPVCYAAMKAHQFGIEMLALLLEKGNADASLTNKDGWTALHEASHKGPPAAVELLLRKGANPLARTRGGARFDPAQMTCREVAEHKKSTPTGRGQIVAMLRQAEEKWGARELQEGAGTKGEGSEGWQLLEKR